MKRVLISTGGAAAAALLMVTANYHIVTESAVCGVTLQKRMSRSLSETFFHLDFVGHMPVIAGRPQHLMIVVSMERAVTPINEAPAKTCGQDLHMGMTREAVIPRIGRTANTETS